MFISAFLIDSLESASDSLVVFDNNSWNDSMLILKEVEAHHSGNYLCEADNGISPKLKKLIYVKVIGKKRNLKSSFKKSFFVLLL